MKKYLQLNDIAAYKISLNLSQYVWDIVAQWNYFSKDTVGKQFVRSIDSISALIAEGFGRYTKKDKTNFYRMSIGSVKESLDWNEKSLQRKLITNKQYSYIIKELTDLPKEIYHLINYTNNKLKT